MAKRTSKIGPKNVKNSQKKDTVMIDKISIVSGASLGYKSAIEYCREQLDGQFWGDIDDFPEALQVF